MLRARLTLFISQTSIALLGLALGLAATHHGQAQESVPQTTRLEVTGRPVPSPTPSQDDTRPKLNHIMKEVSGTQITVTKKATVIKLDQQPTVIGNNQQELFSKAPGFLVTQQQTPGQFNFSYRGLGNPQESEFIHSLQDRVPMMTDWIGFPTLYYSPLPQASARSSLSGAVPACFTVRSRRRRLTLSRSTPPRGRHGAATPNRWEAVTAYIQPLMFFRALRVLSSSRPTSAMFIPTASVITVSQTFFRGTSTLVTGRIQHSFGPLIFMPTTCRSAILAESRSSSSIRTRISHLLPITTTGSIVTMSL